MERGIITEQTVPTQNFIVTPTIDIENVTDIKTSAILMLNITQVTGSLISQIKLATVLGQVTSVVLYKQLSGTSTKVPGMYVYALCLPAGRYRLALQPIYASPPPFGSVRAMYISNLTCSAYPKKMSKDITF